MSTREELIAKIKAAQEHRKLSAELWLENVRKAVGK